MQHKFPRTDCGKSEPSPDPLLRGRKLLSPEAGHCNAFGSTPGRGLKWGEIGLWQGNAGHTIATTCRAVSHSSWNSAWVQLHFLSNDASVRLFPAVVPIRSPDLWILEYLRYPANNLCLTWFWQYLLLWEQIMTNKRVPDVKHGIYDVWNRHVTPNLHVKRGKWCFRKNWIWGPRDFQHSEDNPVTNSSLTFLIIFLCV